MKKQIFCTIVLLSLILNFHTQSYGHDNSTEAIISDLEDNTQAGTLESEDESENGSLVSQSLQLSMSLDQLTVDGQNPEDQSLSTTTDSEEKKQVKNTELQNQVTSYTVTERLTTSPSLNRDQSSHSEPQIQVHSNASKVKNDQLELDRTDKKELSVSSSENQSEVDSLNLNPPEIPTNQKNKTNLRKKKNFRKVASLGTIPYQVLLWIVTKNDGSRRFINFIKQ